MIPTRSIESIRETAALAEAIAANTKPIWIETQTDEGKWIKRSFANESAASEYERKWARQGVEFRRVDG